jgi:hypothetical protein
MTTTLAASANATKAAGRRSGLSGQAADAAVDQAFRMLRLPTIHSQFEPARPCDCLRRTHRGNWELGIAMADKLIDAAQARWRAIDAPHLVGLVRAGRCGPQAWTV